ncbi:hypothetical protein D9615_001860 [Tricholomella constricta]|uniref:RlpA-like double-psi beta-barrel-protein domain-containing protein-containing protein n=1 Tax=Tricholomella constricta TaxID=117010 RepID=A0A8H5MAA1_9AGAR|nr:hypothetical protein D9615_001860 [Tricholomella constricta]
MERNQALDPQMLLSAALLSLALPLATLGTSSHDHTHNSRHQQIAKRQSGEVELHKRFSGSRWSFYDVGLGACGKHNVESDFIVALNSAQYGGGYPGPQCFKTITMTFNGKTAQATIMDECPGCPYGGLDLSRSLFRYFAAESVGIIHGEWHFGAGAPPPPPKPTTSKWTPPPKPPKTTHRPTTTWTPEPETTTTSHKPKPTTTSSSSSSTRSSSASSTSSSSSTSESAPALVPTSTPADQMGNLQDMGQIILNMGGVAVAAAAAGAA